MISRVELSKIVEVVVMVQEKNSDYVANLDVAAAHCHLPNESLLAILWFLRPCRSLLMPHATGQRTGATMLRFTSSHSRLQVQCYQRPAM